MGIALPRTGHSRRGYHSINGSDEPFPDIEDTDVIQVAEKRQQRSAAGSTDSQFRNLVLGFLTIVFVLVLILLLRPNSHPIHTARANNNGVEQEVPNSVDTEIIINIKQGSLLGKHLKTRDGRDYLAFFGIPYAKPPVNELRFKPPQPAEGWTGIRNSTQFGSECVQHGRQGGWLGTKGREDCLNLNVYTPKTLQELQRREQGTGFPVMVYFHGGGLVGNVFYNGGEYLLDENVLLVTLHYRLGPLGMLNVHSSAAQGNQGLKDQAMALKWIQSNIAAFGGNPEKVLLFGESSGSSSITAHLVSPMSKGLFSRVICESGTILDSTLFSQNPVQDAFNLGGKLNCSVPKQDEIDYQNPERSDVDSLMNCLMNLEAEKLVMTTAEAFTDRSFLYSVEVKSTDDEGEDYEDAFLTDTALKLYQSGYVSNVVPAMLGINNQDGIASSLMIIKTPTFMNAYNMNWTQQGLKALHLKHLLPNPNKFRMDPIEIVNAVHDFYFGLGNNLTLAVSQNITDMFTDRDFTHSMHTTAYFLQQAYEAQRQRQENDRVSSGGGDADSANSNANIYLYYLTEQVSQSHWVEVFSNTFQLKNVSIEDVKGAGNVDGLQYLFRDAGYNYPEIPPGASQYECSKTMVHLWTSFADAGVPNTEGYGGAWEPISGTRPFKWYDIHGNNSTMSTVLNERIKFWDSFAVTDLYF